IEVRAIAVPIAPIIDNEVNLIPCIHTDCQIEIESNSVTVVDGLGPKNLAAILNRNDDAAATIYVCVRHSSGDANRTARWRPPLSNGIVVVPGMPPFPHNNRYV